MSNLLSLRHEACINIPMQHCAKANPRPGSAAREIVSLLAITFVLLVPASLTALPVTHGSLPIADRDSVRDPYTSFLGLLGQSNISARSIAPAVTSHFFVPPTVFGGGFASIPLGFGGGFPSYVPPSPPVVFAPWVGSAFSSVNNNGTLRNVTIGTTSVPDTGATIALLAATLTGLLVLGRRYFRR